MPYQCYDEHTERVAGMRRLEQDDCYVNPHNLHPHIVNNSTENYYSAEEVERVPSMFLMLACIYAAMQLAAAVLVTNPPAPSATERFDERLSTLLPGSPGASSSFSKLLGSASVELTTKEALVTRQFWTMWLGFCLNAYNIVFGARCAVSSVECLSLR